MEEENNRKIVLYGKEFELDKMPEAKLKKLEAEIEERIKLIDKKIQAEEQN